MIGCWSEKSGQRAGVVKVLNKVPEVARLYLLKCLHRRRQPRLRSGVALILLVTEAVSELSDLMGKQKSVTTLMSTFIFFTVHGFSSCIQSVTHIVITMPPEPPNICLVGRRSGQVIPPRSC